MRAWFKNTAVTLLVIGVGFAIYKLTGEGRDLTGFLTAIFNVFYTIVDAISNVLVTAWHTVFHTKK